MKYTWTWFWITFLRPSTEWRDTTAEPSRPCPWFTSRYAVFVFLLLPQCIIRTKLVVTHVRQMWGEECRSTLNISPNVFLMNNWFFWGGAGETVLCLTVESFRSSTGTRSFSILNFLIPRYSGLQGILGNNILLLMWFLPAPVSSPQLYMYQLFRSLAYIHSFGICHRDIKPQNLLLDPETAVLKLCDFGRWGGGYFISTA